MMSPEELATLEQKMIAFKLADARVKESQAARDAVLRDFNECTKQMAELHGVQLPIEDADSLLTPMDYIGDLLDLEIESVVAGGGAGVIEEQLARTDVMLEEDDVKLSARLDAKLNQIKADRKARLEALLEAKREDIQVTDNLAKNLADLEGQVGSTITQRIKDLVPDDFAATFDLVDPDNNPRGYAHVNASLAVGNFEVTFDSAEPDFEPILDDSKREELTGLMKAGTLKLDPSERPGAHDDATAFDGGCIHLTAEPPIKRAKTSDE